MYFDEECGKIVDPNVAGTGKPNFGINSEIAGTTGGNDLLIGSSNLHASWDDAAVKGAMIVANVHNGSLDDFAKAILKLPPTGWQTTGDPETWAELWATEVLPLGKQALTRITTGEGTPHAANGILTCQMQVIRNTGYADWAAQQALVQLGKAGFRLAALLQAVFEGR